MANKIIAKILNEDTKKLQKSANEFKDQVSETLSLLNTGERVEVK